MTSPTALNEVLAHAVRVRVTNGGATDKGPLSKDLLVDTGEPTALRDMIHTLAVAQVTDMLCMCLGEVAFEFFGPGGRCLAVVGLHHGWSIRWSGWAGDAELADGHAPLRWLAAQGHPEPLARQQAHDRQHAEQREQTLRDQAAWRNAAPSAVWDLVDAAVSGGPFEVTALEVARRLEESIADGVERAVATLAWYGSGTGRYTGFPLYEALPQLALRELPIEQIVAALQAHPGGAAVEAGAIRHLCGWKARTHQADDIAQIPTDLRLHLLQVARQSPDAPTRTRAEQCLTKPADPVP